MCRHWRNPVKGKEWPIFIILTLLYLAVPGFSVDWVQRLEKSLWSRWKTHRKNANSQLHGPREPSPFWEGHSRLICTNKSKCWAQNQGQRLKLSIGILRFPLEQPPRKIFRWLEAWNDIKREQVRGKPGGPRTPFFENTDSLVSHSARLCLHDFEHQPCWLMTVAPSLPFLWAAREVPVSSLARHLPWGKEKRGQLNSDGGSCLNCSGVYAERTR